MFEAWQLICFVVLRLKFQFTTYATREQSNLSSIRSQLEGYRSKNYPSRKKSSSSTNLSHLEGYPSKNYPLKNAINKIRREYNVIYNRIRTVRNLCWKLKKLFALWCIDWNYSNLQLTYGEISQTCHQSNLTWKVTGQRIIICGKSSTK